ncbi:hypothetical protein RFI_38073, partial [Reticulomyxa filosa]
PCTPLPPNDPSISTKRYSGQGVVPCYKKPRSIDEQKQEKIKAKRRQNALKKRSNETKDQSKKEEEEEEEDNDDNDNDIGNENGNENDNDDNKDENEDEKKEEDEKEAETKTMEIGHAIQHGKDVTAPANTLPYFNGSSADSDSNSLHLMHSTQTNSPFLPNGAHMDPMSKPTTRVDVARDMLFSIHDFPTRAIPFTTATVVNNKPVIAYMPGSLTPNAPHRSIIGELKQINT